MKSVSIVFLIVILTSFSCNTTRRDHPQNSSVPGGSVMLDYAEKFSIDTRDKLSILKVYTPWQNAADAHFEYLLFPKGIPLKDSLKNVSLIRTPISRAVIMSTTFISFIDTLGMLSSVKGVSGGNYIYNQELRKYMQNGHTRDVGFDGALNYELLVDMNPEVVFLFGVQSGIVQLMDKLQEIGIPAVICADYLEPHPLGRAEWLRFFAVFYGKEKLASSIFDEISEAYNTLADSASGLDFTPTVLLGLPWKDTWYIAGGKSFAAKLIHDAGASYIFKDEDHAEAKPYNIESVFSRAMHADFWINPGIAETKENILDHDERFGKLKAMIDGKVYNNNKRLGPGGGNDYWESGILHPEILLNDLVNIFHSDSVSASALNYYLKID